jgi:hypothetical protein
VKRIIIFASALAALGMTACETTDDGSDGADAGATGAASALHCTGAEGDKAVAYDNSVGISLPAQRTCLNVTLSSMLQGTKGDTQPAAMAKDASGNFYVAGMTKGFLDTTYGDVFVAKFTPAGELTWFKTYGTNQKDAFPLTGVHDPSSGSEGMLTVDKDGGLYVIGNYMANHGVVIKLDGDGKALWTKGVAKQAFQAVSVAKGVVHIAGDLGIYALDAATGDNRGQFGFKLKDGAASRMFSIHATESGPIYLGGWAGFSGDDDAVLIKLKHDGTAYVVEWDQRVPSPKGAKVSSIDVAADGAIYVGLNITGAADVRVEVLKFDDTGKMTWARRYGNSLQSDTNLVKVVGNQLIVAGNTLATGTATFSDGKNGDGMLLLVNADGTLAKEHYFFTGTNPASYDAVRDVEVIDGKLIVITDHYGSANFGEWRDPNEYGDGKLEHEWKTVAPAEYLLQDTGLEQQTGLEDLKNLDEVSEIPDGTWSDLTANALVKTVAKEAGNAHSSTVYSIIADYLSAN